MKKKKVIAVGIILLIFMFVVLVYFFLKPKISGNTISSSKKSSASLPVIITLENFPGYLAKQNIIQELPKNAQISLMFSDTGKSYTIMQGSVKQGQAGKPDAVINIPSKYISKLGSFCSTMEEAINNGELSYELKASKVSLLWKYRGMMKYGGCFG